MVYLEFTDITSVIYRCITCGLLIRVRAERSGVWGLELWGSGLRAFSFAV